MSDELREKIARTLDYLHDPWPGGIDAHWEQGRRADGYRLDADAILPIVEAEVRRAQAEVWDAATRNALNFAYLNQEDRITLYLRPPHDRNPYTDEETR